MSEFVVGVAIVVVGSALVAVLGISGRDSGTTSTSPEGNGASTYGHRTNVTFTVENDEREGVWALTSPVMRRFGDRDERPLNAARWLPNGTPVVIRCAVRGTEYQVIINEEPIKWRFFAKSGEGIYLPMAGFRQTTEDGAQNFVPCRD
jgi:hypothetical protein